MNNRYIIHHAPVPLSQAPENQPLFCFLSVQICLLWFFLRKSQTFFQSNGIIFNSRGDEWNYQFLHFSNKNQTTLVIIFFLIITKLIGVKYLIVILICISLMTNHTQHLFMHFLTICISSSEKSLSSSFGHLKKWVVCPFFAAL